MNRRQKKKAYKKKYGYNPPKTEIRYHQKYYAKMISKSLNNMVYTVRNAVDVITKTFTAMFDAVKSGIENIRTMPEEEFEEIVNQHPELSPKDIATLKTLRRNGDA